MSSTITSGKAAAVLVKSDGELIYALFEKTHESNVFPQNPHWCCIAFGAFAEVMKVVFSHASACEGGGLQGTGRRQILPENYITAWKREIASPVLLSDVQVSLKLGTWRDTVNKESLPEFIEICGNLGKSAIATRVRFGETVTVSLYDEIELMLALYGVNKVFSPWRILEHHHINVLPRPELGTKGASGEINPEAYSVKRFGQFNVIVKMGKGRWENKGWEYSAVSQYIQDVAYDCEMKKAGSAKALIAAFRDTCRAALPVEEDAMLRFAFDYSGESSVRWQNQEMQQLAMEAGLCSDPADAPASFVLRYGDIKKSHRLTHLKNQVEWCVNDVVPVQPKRQLSSLVQAELELA